MKKGLLDGKIALVTGAGRGIGRDIAIGFAREGARLAIVSRTAAELRETERELQRIRCAVLAVKSDISRENDVSRLANAVKNKFGTVDILVNNAGVLGPLGFITKTGTADWTETVKVNLIGTYLCTKHFLPFMLKKKKGKIINLAGGGAAYPKPFFTAYSASKAGVIRLTDTLAEELKSYNIQVNALAPGGVKTRIQEQICSCRALAEEVREESRGILEGKGTQPTKIIALALFLASGLSDGLTGKLIHVNDPWQSWSVADIKRLNCQEFYTLRRINPR